jgi:hypothetical protein
LSAWSATTLSVALASSGVRTMCTANSAGESPDEFVDCIIFIFVTCCATKYRTNRKWVQCVCAKNLPQGDYTRREETSRAEPSRVKAGSNTSTVALRVVGGDEKGSLESETVKYNRESQGTRIREWLRWRGPAAISNDRPVLSAERTPHINKPATVWE